jgi:elongation factor Ts
VEAERELYHKEAADKPEAIQEQIVKVKMSTFYQQVCLMNQPYVREESRTVRELVNEAVATIGENIEVRRFVRWELGKA